MTQQSLLKFPWKVFFLSSICEYLTFCSNTVYIWICHTYLVLFNLTSHQPFQTLNHTSMMTSFWYWGFHKWTHLSDSWCVIFECAAQTVFINHYITLCNLILISVTITPKSHSTLLFSKYSSSISLIICKFFIPDAYFTFFKA